MTPNKYMKQEREKSLLYTPFQEIIAVQIHNFHRKFAAQMKIFRWETADFCEITEKRTWKKVVKHSDDPGKYTGDPGEIVICKNTLEIS